MKIWLKALALSAFFFMINFHLAYAADTSYYLSLTGNDANSGVSTSAAWATLDYACAKLQAGDTLYVMEGTYVGQHCDIANAGAEGRPITITAYENMPIFKGVETIVGNSTESNLNNAGIAFNAEYKDYINIKKIKFENYYRGVLGIGSYFHLNNSDVGNMAMQVLWIDGHIYSRKNGNGSLHDVYIEGNKIHDTAMTDSAGPNMININGVVRSDGEGMTYGVYFRNNEIYGKTLHATINIQSFNPGCVYNGSPIGQIGMQDLFFEDNYIHDIWGDTASGGFYTIYGVAEKVTIRNNRISNTSAGIIGAYSDSLIEGNVIEDVFKFPGINMISSDADIGSRNKNTIIRNNILITSNASNTIGRTMKISASDDFTIMGNSIQENTVIGTATIPTVVNIKDSTKEEYYIKGQTYGTALVEYADGRLFKASKSTPWNAPALWESEKYFKNGSRASVQSQNAYDDRIRITTYPAYTLPSFDYLTIDGININKATDTWNFTVSSSVPENPTTFILETIHPATTYSIRRDGTEIATVSTDNSGKLTYSYTLAGNEYDASHTFQFVFTGSPAPITYPLSVNSGSGSGSYASGQTVSISANAPQSGKVFDRWTGDTGYISGIISATTTLTMPSQSITLTATYKDNASSGGSSSSGSSSSGSTSGSSSSGSSSGTSSGSTSSPDSSNSTPNTSTGTSPYLTGTLLKTASSFKVYVVIEGKKKWIPTPQVFTQLGYQWTQIKILTDTELSSIPDYEDNLIRALGNYKVYLVVQGVKRHIPNPEVFLNYGFNWTDVKDVPQATIDKYQNTYLIQEDGKDSVYYLRSDNVRKLIPTAEVFDSYSDKKEDIQVISAFEMQYYPISNLIKLNSSNDIYLVEGNLKRRITSPMAFNRLRLNWNRVMSVNQYEFEFYISGEEIR